MIECKFPDGVPVGLRHVGLVGLVVDENRILLTKRSENSHLEAGKWTPPGGYMDRGETAVKGIEREVLEETGYESEVQGLFWISDNPQRPGGRDRQNVDLIFLLFAGELVCEHDDECDEVRWFDLNELPRESDFAFDHYVAIQRYIQSYKKEGKIRLLNV
jgi:8-oxo-dGTP diphosphatase